jgi:hypothetical protein
MILALDPGAYAPGLCRHALRAFWLSGRKGFYRAKAGLLNVKRRLLRHGFVRDQIFNRHFQHVRARLQATQVDF